MGAKRLVCFKSFSKQCPTYSNCKRASKIEKRTTVKNEEAGREKSSWSKRLRGRERHKQRGWLDWTYGL